MPARRPRVVEIGGVVLVAGLEEASLLTLLNVKRLASEQNHGR